MKITELKGKVISDQTGAFPILSRKGNKYFMVFYDHNTNATLVYPLKSLSQQNIFDAQINMHGYLNNRGFTPKVQILDNEYLEAL